jgi:hypothetical protein
MMMLYFDRYMWNHRRPSIAGSTGTHIGIVRLRIRILCVIALSLLILRYVAEGERARPMQVLVAGFAALQVALRVSVPFGITTSTATRRTVTFMQQSALASTLASTPPSYGLYEVQEEMLVRRGIYEEDLMRHAKSTPLLQVQVEPPHLSPSYTASKMQRNGGGGGFGKTKTMNTGTVPSVVPVSTSSYANDAKHYASILRRDGLVRIDHVIPSDIADDMKEFVLKLRKESIQQIQNNTIQSSRRFADVLLRNNRCDLKIPIGKNNTRPTPVVPALYQVLCQSPVTETIAYAFQSNPEIHTDTNTGTGTDDDAFKNAVLYELSCMISDYGSNRQVIHPDTPYRTTTSNSNDVHGDTLPTLLTCFIALQDIELDMGPTIFLPNTHSQFAHELFAQDSIIARTNDTESLSPKDVLLRDTPFVVGTLTKGYVCAVFSVDLL